MYGHNTNECMHLQDIIEKLIRERKLQQFVKTTSDGRQGTSDPNRGQATHRAEELTRTGGRLVINTIVGGPYPADKSWHEMERYASTIKHVNFECCSSTEDGALAKQQCTMADDIVFRNRDADKLETLTIDPMVIRS